MEQSLYKELCLRGLAVKSLSLKDTWIFLLKQALPQSIKLKQADVSFLEKVHQ